MSQVQIFILAMKKIWYVYLINLQKKQTHKKILKCPNVDKSKLRELYGFIRELCRTNNNNKNWDRERERE